MLAANTTTMALATKAITDVLGASGATVEVLGKAVPGHDGDTTMDAVTSSDVTPMVRSPGTAASVTVVVATPSASVTVFVSLIASSGDWEVNNDHFTESPPTG